ncbi:hemolysin family protein [Blastococcus sp. Marseille-P5729]|uniref:hemolysin family protein n=1 Tax=Blastococcus sp. Marseille-P5729 TaxID=2086582 RepID=UPI000D0EE156|nr:hemolysin family protein [Blastococcus sp. Marseille-P5729]
MASSDITLAVVAFVLVVVAGLFAAIDASLQRVSKAQVAELEKEGKRGAGSLRDVVADLPRHTNLLLLLRLACEMTAVVMATVVITNYVEATWVQVVAAAVGMTLISFVLIGVGPRTLGRQHPYAIALPTAALVRTFGIILGPIASLLILIGNAITPGKGFREGPFATEVELRELVDIAEQTGVVEHEEREMVHAVFELGDTIVREVMVPRPDVVWIEGSKSVGQALALALRSGFSRIPVIGENVDDITGVVYLKDLVRRTQGAGADAARQIRTSEVMREASFVPESKPVDDLLREMQINRIHMAVVIDEYGGTAGLVTIEDILEEIVGEIADEYDMHEVAPIVDLEDGAVRMQSRVTVEDLAEKFDVDIEINDDVETVGGLMAQQLGVVPIPGAVVHVAGLRIEAEETVGRRNRISSVLVTREESPAMLEHAEAAHGSTSSERVGAVEDER